MSDDIERLKQLQEAAWRINVWMGSHLRTYHQRTGDSGLPEFFLLEINHLDADCQRITEYWENEK